MAIGGAGILYALFEPTLSRVVRSALAFGGERVHIDLASGEVTGRSFEFRDHVTKLSGSAVSTACFVYGAVPGVSAAPYAWADAVNRPPEPGPELVTVHNCSAANPLPRG